MTLFIKQIHTDIVFNKIVGVKHEDRLFGDTHMVYKT